MATKIFSINFVCDFAFGEHSSPFSAAYHVNERTKWKKINMSAA